MGDRLVGRRAQLAAQARRRGRRARRVTRSPRSPARPTSAAASSARASGTHRAISPWLLSGDGLRAMSEMLMPARPSVSAMSAMTPGRLGTATRSSPAAPPARARPRPARGGGSAACVLPGRRGRRPRAAARGRASRRGDGAVERVGQRVAVGRVDAAPQRRVGAGDARGVAEARAGGRRALAAERVDAPGPTRTLATTCGRWLTAAITRSWTSASIDRGPRAEPGEQAVQALEQGALRRRGRGQVPGGAVEEVLARVLDARRLRARQRVAADEARVARRVDDRALGRADVGDDAACAAPARGPWPRCRRARRPGRRRRPRRRRRARRRGRGGRCGSPRARAASSARGSNPAHRRAEPRAGGQPDRAADEPHPDDGDDQAPTKAALPATAAAACTRAA